MKLKYILACSIFACSLSGFAQKEKKVKLEYTYVSAPDEGIKLAKELAFEAAKIDAISREFGTVLSSTTSSVVASKQKADGSMKEVDDFMMLSSTDVRGEWIETTKEPDFKIEVFDNSMNITVTGEGRIREIVSAPIDFQFKVLRNGVEDKFQDAEFYEGDDMFMSFVSPVDGYLTVYLVDNNLDAYCLLPYQCESDGSYAIRANTRYVLFSPDHEQSPAMKNQVDELQMTVSEDMERNQLYVLFSPNKYTKAPDSESAVNSDGLQMPRQLTYQQFQKWMNKCRKHDKDMCYEKTVLTIKRKE